MSALGGFMVAIDNLRRPRNEGESEENRRVTREYHSSPPMVETREEDEDDSEVESWPSSAS